MREQGSKTAKAKPEYEYLDALCRTLAFDVALLDAGGIVRYVNRIWEEFPATREEPQDQVRAGADYLDNYRKAIGRTAAGNAHLAGIRAVLTGEQRSFSIEYTGHSPRGERWFLLRVEAMSNGGGAVVTRTDITETRHAEHELRENEQRYRVLVQTIEGIVWEVAVPSLKFVFVSKQAERILGYPVQQWIDEPDFWLNHLHPDDREWAPEVCRGATERNENHHLEYRMIAADGRIVWFRDFVNVEARDGHAVCLRGVMVDVTDRKVEEALREGEKQILEMIASEAPLDQVLTGVVRLIEPQSDSMTASVLLLDEDGVHMRLGAAPSLSAELIRAMDGLEIGPQSTPCGRAMYSGQTVIASDIQNDQAWAGYHGLAARFGIGGCWTKPILSHRGKVMGAFAMYFRESRKPSAAEIRLTDIAVRIIGIAIERQQAAEELRKRSERIRELAGKLIAIQEEERRRISRELHDDLIQRIAAVAISLSSVKRRLNEPVDQVKRAVESIQQRVSGLEDDVRNLSHQLHPPVLEHAGLVVALRSFTEEFSRLEQIEIKLVVPDPAPLFPEDIGICVYRVVQEALRNIARHSGAGTARVELAVEGSDLILTVRDRGKGFDSRRSRGSGLGLISMEERVRLCQGSVQIASQPKHGTTVRVRIPLKVSDTGQTA